MGPSTPRPRAGKWGGVENGKLMSSLLHLRTAVPIAYRNVSLLNIRFMLFLVMFENFCAAKFNAILKFA